jgi:hypothetical protein
MGTEVTTLLRLPLKRSSFKMCANYSSLAMMRVMKITTLAISSPMTVTGMGMDMDMTTTMDMVMTMATTVTTARTIPTTPMATIHNEKEERREYEFVKWDLV